jgi:hypothetical protein
MGFKEFAISRDLLYLSGAFLGAALGYFWSFVRKDLNLRSRNRRIALALFLLSAMIAGLAISFIASMGAVFTDAGILIVAGIFTLVCAVALRFPRAVAFPLLIIGSLLVVWIGYSCLRPKPVSTAPLVIIANDGANSHVEDEGGVKIISTDGLSSLHIEAVLVEIDPCYPVFGGSRRVQITEISLGTGRLYSDNSLKGPIVQRFYSFLNANNFFRISVQNKSSAIDTAGIAPGSQKSIYVSELAD